MPITFHVDSAAKVIQSLATGTLAYDDIVSHWKAKANIDLRGYAELCDASHASFDVSIQDVQLIAVEMRNAARNEHPERIAVVSTNHFICGLAHTYAALTVQHNPAFKIFSDMEEARSWLYSIPQEACN